MKWGDPIPDGMKITEFHRRCIHNDRVEGVRSLSNTGISECSICRHGRAEGSLLLKTTYASIWVKFCKACGERIVQQVEARLYDLRKEENRKHGKYRFAKGR